MKIILKQPGTKYFSMFSGIGGFEYGINSAIKRIKNVGQANTEKNCTDTKSVNQIRRYSATCIGYSEIDRYAIEIYEKHFKERNYGDCTKIKWETVPAFDLFVGGFPCQAFSIAGKRKGFNDTRGTLFFEIVRALRTKRPKHLLLENVKGLLSHERGRTYGIIKDSLEELGYFVERQTLNSADFGVPQSRERVFIVGHLRERCRGQIFPLRKNDGPSNQKSKRETQNACSTIQSGYSKAHGGDTYIGLRQIGKIGKGGEAGRVYDIRGTARTIKNGGGMGAKTGLYEMGGMKIRRLTPIECERLQGFPDGWTEGLSDGQRYKCLGNAVTTNVVEAVIFQMLKKGCL